MRLNRRKRRLNLLFRRRGMSTMTGMASVEGTNEGARPAGLSAAREGGADDLKKIKGVGPKMEQLLNRLGFYHFDQVAAVDCG